MKRLGIRRLGMVLAVVLGLAPVQAELREFTDVKGRKLKAEFIDLQGERATLRLGTGKVVQVPLERLSEADREFIAKHASGTLAPVELPDRPLHSVTEWNDEQGTNETYFIDYTGKRAFKSNFKSIDRGGFAAGLGKYCVVQGPHYGLIDTKGTTLFGLRTELITKLQAGSDAPIFIAQVGLGDEASFAYLGQNGKSIMRKRFAGARSFNSERAWVNLESGDRPRAGFKGNWTLIDPTGEEILTAQKLEVQDFSEGRAAVALNKSGSKWKIIDTGGENVAAGPFSRVGPFINGTAVVDGQLLGLDGKWVLTREEGWHIEDRHARSENDAIVGRRVTRDKKLTRYAILRRSTGEHLADLPNEIYVDEGFFNGLAKVRNSKTRKAGFIARDGRPVVDVKYSSAERFRNGFADVSLEGLHDRAVMNTAGEVIWKQKRKASLKPPPVQPNPEGLPPK